MPRSTRTRMHSMFSNFRSLGLSLAFAATISAEHLSAAVFFNDLSTTNGGENPTDNSHWLASMFRTDSAAYSVLTATLALDQHFAGLANLDIYNDGGLMPSSLVGTFEAPSTALVGVLSNTAFTIRGLSLAPNTSYWLVLRGIGVGWGWTPDVATNWASSSDAGSSWATNTMHPPRFSVVSGLPAIGDYSGNSIVDAADYTVWRDTLGSTTDLRANGANNGASAGIIDLADLLFWQRNFGRTAGSGAQTGSVPEPSTAALLVIGCVVALVASRR
jgi:hypothetical protein